MDVIHTINIHPDHHVHLTTTVLRKSKLGQNMIALTFNYEIHFNNCETIQYDSKSYYNADMLKKQLRYLIQELTCMELCLVFHWCESHVFFKIC